MLPGDKLKKIPSQERVGLGIWSQNENSVCELNLNLLSQRRWAGLLGWFGKRGQHCPECSQQLLQLCRVGWAKALPLNLSCH